MSLLRLSNTRYPMIRANGIPTDEVANLGISRTYQNIRLFSSMSVIENILIGQQPRLRSNPVDAIFQTYRNRREEKQSIQKAANLLDFVGLTGYANELSKNLPYGAQRRLEIARALGNNPHLLLLDEPCAGMNPHESDAMIELINTLRSELKITIILIEHDMKVVMNISDHIVVLDHGEKIAEGTPEVIRHDQRVIEDTLEIKYHLYPIQQTIFAYSIQHLLLDSIHEPDLDRDFHG